MKKVLLVLFAALLGIITASLQLRTSYATDKTIAQAQNATTQLSSPKTASAINVAGTPSSGEYINMCGKGYLSCTTNCNEHYACEAACNPDEGWCDGQGSNYVYKLVCDGKSEECGNGIGNLVNMYPPTQGKVDITEGVSCGQTVQLDVFTKQCDAAGGWDCGAEDMKGYIVWYSGDCAPPVQTPACGTSCANDPSICNNAPNGCTACVNGTCQTPTPACGTSCSSNTDCQQIAGCTACVSGTCQAPPTQAPPTQAPPTQAPPTQAPPTPTPDFNPGMCKCDGMTATTLIPGETVTFTTKGKVEGADTSKAKIPDMTFYVGVGDNTSAKVLERSQPVPAKVTSSTPGSVHYESEWQYTVPAQVTPGAVYRAWTQINCERQTAANVTSSQNAAVASATDSKEDTSKKGFLSSIVDFFATIFGMRKEAAQTQHIADTSTPADENVSVANEKSIQLDTFEPGQVLEQSCTMVKFQFKGKGSNN